MDIASEKGYSSNETDVEDYGCEDESFLKEKELEDPQSTGRPNFSAVQKAKTSLKALNWKNTAATVCLWLAVIICSAAFSLMAPFFPQEVITS